MDYNATDNNDNNNTGDNNTDVNNNNDNNTNTDNNTGDWRESIHEDFRSHIGEDIKDVNSLAKQYIEQQKFLGSSIRIPGEDASDEARAEFSEKILKHAPNLVRRPDPSDEKATAEFWEMVGVPKDADGYTLKEVPEDMNPDFIEGVKAQALRYGLTKQGFEQYVKDQYELQKAQADANNQAQTESLKAIRNEWGAATDDKLSDISKFTTEMGFPKDFNEALSKNQVSGEWLKVIDTIITQFGGIKENAEGVFQRQGSQVDTPQDIEYKIQDIESNPAYLKQGHPQQAMLIKKRIELLDKLTAARQR